ncbi:MAG TPA: hypothetical protein ENK57_09405 [Polyangiaceae bacterium]|nr:hypothetical protein [Polyangiaceae bacterium]
MTIAQHISIRPADGRPLFNDVGARRLFTRKVVTVGAPFEPIAWGAGDTHAHVATMGEDRAAAAELARRLESSLTHVLKLSDGFAPAKVKAVSDQYHLLATLPYIVRQAQRHGVRCDPFHEGSSLPDMVGLRHLAPDLPGRLRRLAPRFDPRRFLGALGPCPALDDADAWAEATAAVLGCAIEGRGPLVAAARRAVVALAPEASTASLCSALKCRPRTLRRLRADAPLPPMLRDAIVAQACWRSSTRAQLVDVAA